MNGTKSRRLILPIAFLILTIASQAWIFSNSLMDGTQSSEQSGRVVEIVRPAYQEVLPAVNIEPTEENIHHYVRKTAHFTEFALLGFLGLLTVFFFGPKKRKPLLYAIPPVLCILTSIADELIQSAVSGRSSQWTDSLLDSAGGMTGVLLGAITALIICAFRRKKEKKKRACGGEKSPEAAGDNT